ncbi:MAG: hypothetical protein KDA96_18680 [Planctomycetaceae bacterium]|nr:hypothetical protein [Planctomycetaceae bacterium]
MESVDSENPFAPPKTELADRIAAPSRSRTGLMVAWNLAVLINVPLPFIWGLSNTDGMGALAMMAGILVVASTGSCLCLYYPHIMKRISIGSILQPFFPVMQMMAGMLAIAMTRGIFSLATGTTASNLSVVPAVVATVLTGLFLILPSLLVGALVCLLFGIDRDPAVAQLMSESETEALQNNKFPDSKSAGVR